MAKLRRSCSRWFLFKYWTRIEWTTVKHNARYTLYAPEYFNVRWFLSDTYKRIAHIFRETLEG